MNQSHKEFIDIKTAIERFSMQLDRFIACVMVA